MLTYCFAQTPFGEVCIAAGPAGVRAMVFVDDRALAYEDLVRRCDTELLREGEGAMHALAVRAAQGEPVQVPLDMRGTSIQLRVWQELLRIPPAETRTYAHIAAAIGMPRAYRAVGTAIGQNPLALLVPCHRVLPASGGIGNYRWGSERKALILAWERARRTALALVC